MTKSNQLDWLLFVYVNNVVFSEYVSSKKKAPAANAVGAC